MFGLVGLFPDYGMIVVGANMGVSRMTREHLGIALALKIPFYIVITKIDISPPEVMEKTYENLVRIIWLPQVDKLPILVNQETDIDKLVDGIYNNQVVPIFKISNVTGEGFDKMKDFLPKLKSRVSSSG